MVKIKGKKLYMSQVWKKMKVIPVTILNIGKNSDAFKTLKEGERIVISGKSKGRGFQGVVKRHGFHGMDKSHGTKHHLRAPGSIGSAGLGRVIPGKKMAGRMGQETITIKNIEIIELRPDKGEVLIKGAAPGMKKSEIEIRVGDK